MLPLLLQVLKLEINENIFRFISLYCLIVLLVIVIIVKNCIILNERVTKLHDNYCQPFIFYITALILWFYSNTYTQHTFVQQTTAQLNVSDVYFCFVLWPVQKISGHLNDLKVLDNI